MIRMTIFVRLRKFQGGGKIVLAKDEEAVVL